MERLEEKIVQTIKNLISDFDAYPDKYLTESDVRCLLFKKLTTLFPAEPQETEDGSHSIPLHTVKVERNFKVFK